MMQANKKCFSLVDAFFPYSAAAVAAATAVSRLFSFLIALELVEEYSPADNALNSLDLS